MIEGFATRDFLAEGKRYQVCGRTVSSVTQGLTAFRGCSGIP